MNSFLIKASIILSLFFFALFSCNNGDNLNKKVQGNWIIKNASRNGRITYTLEGAYIKLYDYNFLETNIFGDSIITNYNFQENILIPDSFFAKIFVDKVNMDTLWLHTTISNNLFFFELLNNSENEKNISY